MWTKLQVPSRELKLPSTWIKQTTFSLPGQYGFTGSRSFSQGQGQNPASTAPVPSDWTSIQFPHPQKSTIHKIHKWNLPNRRVSPVTLNSFNWGHSSWRSINVEFFLGVCLVRPWSASTAWLGNLTCPLYPTRKKRKTLKTREDGCLCGFYTGHQEGYMHEAGILLLQGVTCRIRILLVG